MERFHSCLKRVVSLTFKQAKYQQHLHTIMSVDGTITKEIANMNLDTSKSSGSRVSRAKRLLDESTERVNVARKKARRDFLKLQVLGCKQRLDEAVLRVLQFQENPPQHFINNPREKLKKLQVFEDRRQICLLQLVEAEEEILDESDEEE